MISIIRSCCSSVILLSLGKQSPRRKISAPTSSKGPEMDSDTLPVLIIIGEGNPSQQKMEFPSHTTVRTDLRARRFSLFLRAWPREHLLSPSSFRLPSRCLSFGCIHPADQADQDLSPVSTYVPRTPRTVAVRPGRSYSVRTCSGCSKKQFYSAERR